MLDFGGSVVGLQSSDGRDLTVIIEKLEGDCLRCRGSSTSDEIVKIVLPPNFFNRGHLHVWRTNSSHQFIQDATDAAIDPNDGAVSVLVRGGITPYSYEVRVIP